MNYYIADPHLGHKNIIRLNNRPFSSIVEMNETIINNWNSTVTDNDDVYIIGDFAFGDAAEFLRRLKGRKHLVVGNHDTQTVKNCRQYFVEIKDILEVVDDGVHIVLCHYPLVEWNGYFRGTKHFYGHVHNNFHNSTCEYARNMKNAYNVGADVIGFCPKTYKEIVGG